VNSDDFPGVRLGIAEDMNRAVGRGPFVSSDPVVIDAPRPSLTEDDRSSVTGVERGRQLDHGNVQNPVALARVDLDLDSATSSIGKIARVDLSHYRQFGLPNPRIVLPSPQHSHTSRL